MEDKSLGYSKPNGAPVDADFIRQHAPTCMRRDARTGMLRLDYSNVDAINAAHDAMLATKAAEEAASLSLAEPAMESNRSANSSDSSSQWRPPRLHRCASMVDTLVWGRLANMSAAALHAKSQPQIDARRKAIADAKAKEAAKAKAKAISNTKAIAMAMAAALTNAAIANAAIANATTGDSDAAIAAANAIVHDIAIAAANAAASISTHPPVTAAAVDPVDDGDVGDDAAGSAFAAAVTAGVASILQPLPWSVVLPTVVHHREEESYATARSQFMDRVPTSDPSLAVRQTNRQGFYLDSLQTWIGDEEEKEEHQAASSDLAPSSLGSTAVPTGCSASLSSSVAFWTSFNGGVQPPPEASPGDAHGSLSLSASDCFVRENFLYPLLLRFPVANPRHDTLPKFMMRTRAAAASWVHWPTAARDELRHSGWTVMLRSRSRLTNDALHREPRVTLHAPPIARLMHFTNAYSTRTLITQQRNESGTTHAERFYRRMVQQIKQLPCIDDHQE